MGIKAYYFAIMVLARFVIWLALLDDKNPDEEPWETKLREILQKHEAIDDSLPF